MATIPVVFVPPQHGGHPGRQATVWVMHGPPGSGKTTAAHALRERHPDEVVVLTRDDFRVMQRCLPVGSPAQEWAITQMMLASARAVLAYGYDVVVDTTNVQAGQVQLWRDLAAECGAQVEVHNLAWVPLDVCQQRVRERAAAGGRDVDARVVEEMWQLGQRTA